MSLCSALCNSSFVPRCNYTLKLCYINFMPGHDTKHVQLFFWLTLGSRPTTTYCTGEELSTVHAFRTYTNRQPDCSLNPHFLHQIYQVPVPPHDQLSPHTDALSCCSCKVSPLYMFQVWWVRSLSSWLQTYCRGHLCWSLDCVFLFSHEDCGFCALSPQGSLVWLRHNT